MSRSKLIRDISEVEFFGHLALGNIPGSIRWNKFGYNKAVGNTEVLISSGGVYGLPDTSDTIVITSTVPASDNPTGAGARKVKIWGCADDWSEQTEEIELGATGLLNFRRVFTARVISAGTVTAIGGGNVGVISINQTAGTPMLSIDLNEGSSLCACYTVPLNKTVLIWEASTNVGEGKDSLNRLKVRKANGGITPFTTEGIRNNFENQVGRTFVIPTPISEKTDIIFTSVSSAAGTAVSGSFLMEIIDNTI